MDKNSPFFRYQELKQRIAQLSLACGRNSNEPILLVVTKTQPIEAIRQVYEAGCRHFGENRVQEALEKIPLLPADICWHLIGSLQSNKVNKAISLFPCIQSVDSVELARKISIASQKKEISTSILLQVNTSREKSKHGLSPEAWREKLEEIDSLPSIRLEGLMTIAPFSSDAKIVRDCFKQLRLLKEEFKEKVKNPAIFHHLSMGMSHDYSLAIEEGATILRIGSAIFGERIA